MPTEISIPFRLDNTGRIATVTNPNDQIRQHVMSLVNTAPSERVVIGDYGIPVIDGLFEDDDDTLAFELGDRIETAFARWEPGVTLLDLTPSDTPTNDGLSTIDLQYRRNDAPDTSAAANTNTAVVKISGHVDEIIRG